MENIKGMSLLKQLIPVKIKAAFRDYVERKFRFKDEAYKKLLRQREKAENAIPKINLQQKHIENLRVLLDRQAFLKQMPKNAVCAEIGVNEGEFSEDILK